MQATDASLAIVSDAVSRKRTTTEVSSQSSFHHSKVEVDSLELTSHMALCKHYQCHFWWMLIHKFTNLKIHEL